LSDSSAAIIEAFDVLNENFAAGSAGYGIPHPIIFVIDANGVITHRFSEADYADRPDIGSVLKAIGN